MINNPEFDQYADDYDAALAQSLELTGEDKHYFARGRLNLIADFLKQEHVDIKSVLDFGCGTGSSTPYFFESLQVQSVVGVDVSAKSLDVARRIHGCDQVRFQEIEKYEPSGEFDLAFTNGVFHHIPLDFRKQAVDYVYRSLRPGGLFTFWENNPWNLGARLVMSRCPFDKDAQTLSPPAARRLLRSRKFEILRTSYLFIFPHSLSWLRSLERPLVSIPLGAQYLIICRKPLE
jgi:SAM-dependent methyltransferase